MERNSKSVGSKTGRAQEELDYRHGTWQISRQDLLFKYCSVAKA